MNGHPFSQDPSNTAAFAAISGSEPLVSANGETRAVVIGGGTGAPVSIRTLLSMGFETSAVVAMADDGGSTGILREEANVTPPGDVRKCLAAFAKDPNDPLTRAFKYRFEFAQNHTLGNLLLSALEDACGSFPEAIAICEKLLDARGHVYPSTLDRVTLCARTRDGSNLVGQANACASSTALQYVWLQAAEEPEPYAPALEAIEQADLIVLGPGSLFTSIVPNLLIPGVVDAIRASKGRTLFVCSLADMQGETWGLSAKEHIEALMEHGMYGLLDYVLVHTPAQLRPDNALSESYNAAVGERECPSTMSDLGDAQLSGRIRPVAVSYADVQAIQAEGPVVVARNLVDPQRPTWHDPRALRAAFAGVMRLCRSPRR
ncbi:gluconeogenesis factor YvcK family protein [Raoultibacter phocaeensis]|uniref:gluconeogenesis factor YvcK family protein n=1 Tax=Raoultibacter phocaeensis TaxID=2479841 RepID=UPI00111858DD|nr:gluconeogenesis factor YvcK family protein [Raoultibacter phocaeensis]